MTPAQEELIPVYWEKWRKIILSTAPTDRKKAAEAVKNVYTLMGKPEPEIRFFASPKAGKLAIFNQAPEQLAKELGSPLFTIPLSLEMLGEIQQETGKKIWEKFQSKWLLSESNLPPMFQPMVVAIQQLGEEISPVEWQKLEDLQEQLRQQIIQEWWPQYRGKLWEQMRQQPGGEILVQLGDYLWQNLGERVLEETLNQPLLQQWETDLKRSLHPWLRIIDGIGLGYSILRPHVDASNVAMIDFCVSVLGWKCDRHKWEVLQSLVTECGWVFPFEKICIVSDRPLHLHFNELHRLHAEGKPAIQFSDGYSIYAYDNVILPEKYCKLHPHLWQAQWLLTENNAELRRVLIQGIGYGRICQELAAREIDSWREYTLLKIDNEIDIEPIHLLKMTCPSTAHIHALRVPPHLTSARAAIRWVNWDIDPEEFSIAT